MKNKIITPDGVVYSDTPYYTDTLEVVTEEQTPTATMFIEGTPEVNLSDATWQTSELLAPSVDIRITTIVAYAHARNWSMFAITLVKFIDRGGFVDKDYKTDVRLIVGK